MTELISFLSSPVRNQWLQIGTIEVYLRKGFHRVNDVVTDTLDVANISNDPNARGQGQFKSLLNDIFHVLENHPELRGKMAGVYVESVLNDRLAESLEHRLGFQLVPTQPPSFYKPLRL